VCDCYQCIHYMEECTVINDPYASCDYYQNRYEVYQKEVEDIHQDIHIEELLDQNIETQIEYLLLSDN
jgi:hypothetical protein